MADFISYLPQMPNLQFSPFIIQYAFLALLFGIILVFLIQLSRNRIFIEVYDSVKDGYVSLGGRYRRMFDNDTKMFYLRPMMGKTRIPDFDPSYFQKVDGMPILGVTRQIKVIKINNYTYMPLLPTLDEMQFCSAITNNSIAWQHTELNREFKRKVAQGLIINLIIIAAPAFLILVLFIFLFMGIYFDIYNINMASQKISFATEALIKSFGKGA